MPIKNLGTVLNDHEVSYMFVGGIAISYYGTPRISADLPKGIDYDVDIWYKATNTNFLKLIKAIGKISPELDNDLQKSYLTPKRPL